MPSTYNKCDCSSTEHIQCASTFVAKACTCEFVLPCRDGRGCLKEGTSTRMLLVAILFRKTEYQASGARQPLGGDSGHDHTVGVKGARSVRAGSMNM